MSRFNRPPFDPCATKSLGEEASNRLLFDWWCDEGEPERESDRLQFIASLKGKPTPFRSRAPLQNDPAPPLNRWAPQGFRDVYLLTEPAHVRQALTDVTTFSNIPYAALGGASFLLGLDPGKGYKGIDWHAEQKALVTQALASYSPEWLRLLAKRAVEQAALTSLARPDFDLAQFSEQAALRYMGLLFGYGFQDHPLLEDASRATYRALQYLAIGQHFVSEPGTLPAAQQALGRLVNRTSLLMDDYTRLERSPRIHGFQPGTKWPEGVQPWSELGLSSLGLPLLKLLPTLPGPLSGRDRATVAATMLAGTLGNIQSAVCLLTQSLTNGLADELEALRVASIDKVLEDTLERRMATLPPVPVVPRRTRKNVTLNSGIFGEVTIPAGTDCLLLLEGKPGCVHAPTTESCPRIWGDVADHASAPHACMGHALSMPLIAALMRHTLNLKGLKSALDPLTGEVLQVERLWGFACTRYPLRFDRERVRVQQNLIVSIRIKSPVSENSAHLRRLIAAGVPRIEHALTGFGHLHFAWFEFSDDESQLVLRTIYDGQFEAYVQYFALRVGDLFDGLFEYLEDAPPRPVAEHPQEFVEAIRRHNRAPLAGYLYSAYPRVGADQVRRGEVPKP